MIERIYRALIPDDIAKDIVKSSYAKNLVAVCLISVIASISYAGLFLYLHFPLAAYVLLVNEVILLTPLLIVKYFHSLRVACFVYTASFTLLIFWMTFNLGGLLFASTAYWFVLTPLIAAYIGGIRQGYVWTVISCMAVAVLFLLEKWNYAFPHATVTDPLILEFIGIVGLDLVILTMVLFYESNIKNNLNSLRDMAYKDVLTNIPNRIAYQDQLGLMIESAKKNKSSFSVLYINIDNFEKINAIFGHDIGDELLKLIPIRIKKYMPYVAFMARIDGDEFKIILQDISADDDLREMGDFILSTLRIPYHINDHEIKITASMGMSTFPYDGPDHIYIDRFAELALMKAKNLGGNNYQYFNDELARETAMQVSIERSLPSAIANGELHLNFQLFFSASDSKKVCGFEVLLRWHSRILGEISPNVFIPIAEKIDVIAQIDDWVLNEACKYYRAWQTEGLVDESIPLSANISAQQLYDDNFLDSIELALLESGMQPGNVILELTETAIITDQVRAIAILQKLNDLGIRTVIDDFGVGYTSLSYLPVLPVSGLKIDKSFISAMLVKGSQYGAIVHSIIDLAHKLNLKVVSEGVENQGQLDYLKGVHCDCVQGYYLAKPKNLQEMHAFLKEYKQSHVD